MRQQELKLLRWLKQMLYNNRLMTVRCDAMFIWQHDEVSLHSNVTGKILKAVEMNNLTQN